MSHKNNTSLRSHLRAAAELSIPFISLYMPLFAAAATDDPVSTDLSYGQGLLVSVGGIVDYLVPLFIALALVLFLWGVISFMTSAGDEVARKAGGKRIVWGLAALFVAVSVWGLVGLLNQITGVEAGGGVEYPQSGL